jgi:NADPH:quinone reductase-like Zn-dependent oxidoreductase
MFGSKGVSVERKVMLRRSDDTGGQFSDPVNEHPCDYLLPVARSIVNIASIMAKEGLLPGSRRAVIQTDHGEFTISSVPLPELEPGNVLIRTMAVALNPTDFKMAKNFPCPGAIVGCDFSGVVVAVSELDSSPIASSASSSLENASMVPNSDDHQSPQIHVGDRVFGPLHGSNPANPAGGAFAEYVQAPPDLIIRAPDHLSWAEAAALGGTGHGTLCLAFWDFLQLTGTVERPLQCRSRDNGDDSEHDTNHPAPEPEYVLVYGGSTATGTMALQILRLYAPSLPMHSPLATRPPLPD